MQHFSIFLRIFVPVLFFIIVFGIYIDRSESEGTLSLLKAKQIQMLELKKAFIGSYFQPIIEDIELLSNQSKLQNYLSTKNGKEDLINDYRLFSQINRGYSQVRIIDSNGLEQIRVNYSQDSVEVVDDSLLQDKSDTDYFRKAIKYDKDQIYISAIDLNQEFGTVEVPYNPVLRVSKPLFDSSGNRKGIIITNYNAGTFLSDLSKYYLSQKEEFYFLNSDGYFLSAPKGYSLWGFMFPEFENQTFEHFYPEIWNSTTASGDLFLRSNGGLFLSEKVGFSDFRNTDINAPSIGSENAWILVSRIPGNLLHKQLYSHRKNLIFILAGLAIIGFFVSYIIGKTQHSIRLKNKALEEINATLKKKENELLAKNGELEQFAYITSHDLHEPLRTISSYSELLKEDFENQLGEDGNRYLKYISKSSNRLINLVKGTLTYSSLTNDLAEEAVDLNEVIALVIEDLQVLISERNANITVSKLPRIKGCKTGLRLLFQNLISNGLKFQAPDNEPIINISVKKSNAFIDISVADNGIGISSEFHSKIFQMFQRLHTESEYSGTGIGLALCKKVMDIHEGSISLNSSKNKGTTFVVGFPKNEYG